MANARKRSVRVIAGVALLAGVAVAISHRPAEGQGSVRLCPALVAFDRQSPSLDLPEECTTTIASNLVADQHHPGYYEYISSPPFGNIQPGEHDAAVRFALSATARLDKLELPLYVNMGGPVDIYLTGSQPASTTTSPQPNMAAVVEHWKVAAIPSVASTYPGRLISVTGATLKAGTDYWVVVTAHTPESKVLWWSGTDPASAWKADRYSFSLNGTPAGTWISTNTNPVPGYKVVGVPEQKRRS